MPYVTPDDMIALFDQVELTEVTNRGDEGADTINMTRLEAACRAATGFIDGYLMRVFSLPLVGITETFAETLKVHAANIVRYQLDGRTDEVKDRMRFAIEWLEALVSAEAASSGGGGDTTPGITLTEKIGSVNYGIKDSVWSDERLTSLGF